MKSLTFKFNCKQPQLICKLWRIFTAVWKQEFKDASRCGIPRFKKKKKPGIIKRRKKMLIE